MFSIAWMFERLIEVAAISLVLFTLGSLAALGCRQPVRRMQIIILTLAGSVLAPPLNLLPRLPHWSLPVRRSTAAPDRGPSAERHPLAEARVPLADRQSTGTSLPIATEEIAGPDEPTPSFNAASDVSESSSTVLPAELVSIPTATIIPQSDAAATDQNDSTSRVLASMAQTIDLAPWIVGSYLAGAADVATWWLLG